MQGVPGAKAARRIGHGQVPVLEPQRQGVVIRPKDHDVDVVVRPIGASDHAFDREAPREAPEKRRAPHQVDDGVYGKR